MATKNEALLAQAESLWKMLDDMAETNPDGYKKLMDNVIKEQREHFKPPEPVFCFRATKLPESSNQHVFINICKWDRLSKPRDGDPKTSVLVSNLRNLPEPDSKHSVIDICFHNDIIDQTGQDPKCWKLFASSALDYIKKQTGMQLSTEYQVLRVKYKGNVENLKRFSFSHSFASGPSAMPVGPEQTESSSILDGLSRIVLNGNIKPNGALTGLPSDTIVRKTDQQITKKPLIQEVSTNRQTNVIPKVNVPEYSMKVVSATHERPKCILVKVELPDIKSGKECELDVSRQDLVLCSARYSKLHLKLPQEGNDDETTSTFDRTTRELTIIIPTDT